MTEASSPDWGKSIVEDFSTIDYSYVSRKIHRIHEFFRLEIIGEALNKILKANPEIYISDSRKIIDTRNRIIHGYDSVTSDVLWLIISKSLPILKKEIDKLLK